MPRFTLILATAFAVYLSQMAPSTLAQDQSFYEQEKQEYTDCIALAGADPEIAYINALTWRDTGGGLPARHCVALALTELGRYAEAAVELEIMANNITRGIGWPFAGQGNPLDRDMLADIYAQAANAWLWSGDPEKAVAVFTLALAEVDPLGDGYAGLLIDRATARAGAGDYPEALKDLGMAETMLGESAWVHVLKASAYRSLEQYSDASLELENAFRLEPQHREGLLERGNLRHQTGDDDGARADWLNYLRLYPDSFAAAAVRRNIEAIDVTVEEFDPAPEPVAGDQEG